jgi:hypothetical protein
VRTRRTWLFVGIAVALLGTAAYWKLIRADTATLKGAGMRVEVPRTWDGRTYENTTRLRVLQAASLRLSPQEDDGDVGEATVRRLGSRDIFISVWYWPNWPPAGGNGDAAPLTLPPRIARSDFGSFEGQIAPSQAQLVGLIDGKLVQVRVLFGTRTPSDGQLAEANEVLKTLEIT